MKPHKYELSVYKCLLSIFRDILDEFISINSRFMGRVAVFKIYTNVQFVDRNVCV